MEEPQPLRLALLGFGAVNTTLLTLLEKKRQPLLERHRLKALCVGVADSKGATVRAEGLDVATLLEHKAGGRSVASFPGGSECAGAEAMLDVLGDEGYDILVDSSPADLKDGGVGLKLVRRALTCGKRAILANKAPLVLAFDELTQLAGTGPAAWPPRLLYSATVCGGLPVLNVGRRDMGLTGADFTSVEGVFNSTTNYILSQMGEGKSFDAALAEAQRAGIAESNPSLDVDGWDTANKLVIIVNAVLRHPARLADVKVEGTRSITPEMISEARGRGEVYKLVASAKATEDGGWQLSVRPVTLPAASFLANIAGFEMGVIFHSDLFEVVSLKIDESSVVPTSAAVLRDILHCSGRH